jgi:hypothetical protein
LLVKPRLETLCIITLTNRTTASFNPFRHALTSNAILARNLVKRHRVKRVLPEGVKVIATESA